MLLVVNKVDGMEREDMMLAEFHALGFPLMAVSAEHGHNVRGLEEEIRALLSARAPEDGGPGGRRMTRREAPDVLTREPETGRRTPETGRSFPTGGRCACVCWAVPTRASRRWSTPLSAGSA